MSLTPSSMLPLGTVAPGFDLPAPDGKKYTLENVKRANGLLVIFMCNHCPYVIHMKDQLAFAARRLSDVDVGMIGINANDIESHPQDGPEYMQRDIEVHSYSFPYVSDVSQAVAKAYHATCTPDLFLFDEHLRLAYRGQFDDSRPGSGSANGSDLYRAVDAMLAGNDIPDDQQKPSIGCNIKWK